MYISEADKNQDGFISKDELKNFFVGFIVLDEVEDVDEYVNTYFAELDTDQNGTLTIDEFRVLLETAEEAEVEGEQGEYEDGEYE